jgi:phosphoglycolate phosphatase
MKVVLFDIDGTILWTHGAARRAIHGALEDIFGAALPDGIQFDGKTDPQIVRELLELGDIPVHQIEDRIPQAIARYVELLHVELGGTDLRDKIFPGVLPLLDTLEARDDVLLGLLTGNVREGAVAKLKAVGIDPERFRVGAFGSDHAERPQLPSIARARASTLLGRTIPGRDVVVIGDTPADIGCGRGIGARAIGVATGRYSTDALHACNAAAVFSDLSDTDAVMRAIMED